MKTSKSCLVFFVVLAGMARPATLDSAEVSHPLAEYLKARAAEFDDIPAERRERLNEIAAFALSQREKGRPAKLIFICTHNSRRSQMAQVWATIAAAQHGLDGIEVFSGGTEQTAFNPRAVAALVRAGVNVEQRSTVAQADNPRYEVRFRGEDEPQILFSKVFDQPPNPDAEFAAVMTCSEADKSCPKAPGAAVRIALHYDDPKLADGTQAEATTYDERCREIARDMLFAFSKLAGDP